MPKAPANTNWSVYKKRYNVKWESEAALKDWIRSVPGDGGKAQCRFCRSTLRAHHADLVKYSSVTRAMLVREELPEYFLLPYNLHHHQKPARKRPFEVIRVCSLPFIRQCRRSSQRSRHSLCKELQLRKEHPRTSPASSYQMLKSYQEHFRPRFQIAAHQGHRYRTFSPHHRRIYGHNNIQATLHRHPVFQHHQARDDFNFPRNSSDRGSLRQRPSYPTPYANSSPKRDWTSTT